MDNETKYICMLFGFVALCILIGVLIGSYIEKDILKLAMENGYTQKVENNNHIIWIKEERKIIK